MAAGEIPLQEFAGTTSEIVTPQQSAIQPQAKQELSLEDFAGLPKAKSESEVAHSLKVGLKAAPQNIAGALDAVWGFSLGAVGAAADVGTRLYAGATGESRDTIVKAGRESRQYFTAPLQSPLGRVMKWLGYGEDYEESDVSAALKVVNSYMDRVGPAVEDVTKGVVKAEDFELLNDAMSAIGPEAIARMGRVIKRNPNIIMRGVLPGFEKPRIKGPAAVMQSGELSETGNSYYTPDPAVVEAEAATVKPRIKGPQAVMRPAEQTPEAFQFGTVEQPKQTELPPGMRRGVRGSSEPVVGHWEGPGGEFTETTVKPGLVERGREWLGEDRRWTPREPGKVDPATAAKIAAAGGIAAYIAKNPEDAEKLGLVGGALLAVKGKGGMWHPEAVSRLARPLEESMMPTGRARPGDVHPEEQWANRAVRNYLNKYAGTEGDPLKDVEVPFGDGTKRWEELWDKAIQNPPIQAKHFQDLEGPKPNESIWEVHGRTAEQRKATEVITSHLSHVGDYLRQNVSPEKLQQYDLVRAVKETAANDARVAKDMEKAATASTKGLPVYKEYPDGMRWVELKLQKKLTEEQAKTVRETSQEDLYQARRDGLAGPIIDRYLALGSENKPIKNSYTGGIATGKTPQEAHLSGQLAQEGNQMGHCVGGYCEGVASGESTIYSLRDAKGRSHVTVEVLSPTEGDPKTSLSSISQIKGKQNRAPVAEYLPYVQDFVKSGKWGEVGDLYNTGLIDSQGSRYPQDFPNAYAKLQEQFPGQRYFTNKELQDAEAPGATYPKSQQGFVDPKLLSRMALLSSGAALGAYLNQDAPVTGALVGAVSAALAPRALKATGAAVGQLAKGKFSEAARELIPGPISRAFAEDKSRVRIKAEMDAAELFSRRAELDRSRLINRVLELVPDQAGRERISHWLEGATGIQLNPKEQAAANAMKQFFSDQASKGLDSGVLKDTLENYVTHVFGRDSLPLIDALLAARASGSATTPFAKARTGPPTIAEVNAWMAQNGKKPITADIATIAEHYGKSLTRAIANKSVLDALKERTTNILSGGKDVERPLIMRPGKAPGTYEPVGRTGYVAHPDIVPALKFIFSTDDSASLVRGIEALNTAAKRSAVMLSLFHAKNLVDAFAGASKLQPGKIAIGAALGAAVGATQDDPVTYAMIGAGLGMAYPGAKIAAQAAAPKVFGENPYVKALRKNDPALAKMIDLSFQGGLEYSLKGGGLAVEDIGGAFYQGLQAAQRVLDQAFPPAASALRGVEKLNHAMDGFLWEQLHTGMKLSIFAEKYETLLQNNARAHARDARVPLASEKQLAGIAASFTNDIFGGLNWRRVADEARTKWGAALAQGAYSPTGRRVLQLLMFAPDWTIATTRSAMKAFGSLVGQEAGSSIRGLWEPKTVADLHRQYMLRSAFYYVLVGDGLNVALNGNHLWETDDPTYIHMKDGRKIQYSKHTMEPYHWILNPIQQGMNKLGQVPKEVLNQAFGTEYLAPRIDRGGSVVAGPKMEGSRLSHIGRTINPIGAKQFVEGGVAGGTMGSLGMPIYGKTREERERIRQKRALDRALQGR